MVGCRDTTSPWFSSKYPCSLFIFDCYRHQVDSPVGNELNQLDSDALAALEYTHCPAIQVPPEIRNFPNLLSFELYNCSIRSWLRESAISPEKHPSLMVIVLTRTNMTEFPEGLLGPLPPTLNDVEFSVTNLTKLPDDLGKRWHSLSTFFVEYSELREVPESVFQLPVIVLSFVGNKIESLPPLDKAHRSYYIVDLGKNPLRELPTTNGAQMFSMFLNVEYSNLAILPSWVYSSVGFVYGTGSPYCQTIDASSASASVRRGCSMSDPRGGRIPMNLVDAIKKQSTEDTSSQICSLLNPVSLSNPIE